MNNRNPAAYQHRRVNAADPGWIGIIRSRRSVASAPVAWRYLNRLLAGAVVLTWALAAGIQTRPGLAFCCATLGYATAVLCYAIAGAMR